MKENNGYHESLGVVSMNLLYEINYWSQPMEHFTGLKTDEVAGKCLYEIFPDFKKGLVVNRLKNVSLNGAIEFLSGRLHNDLFKSPFTERTANLSGFLFTLAPLKSDMETIVGIVGVLERTSENAPILIHESRKEEQDVENQPHKTLSDFVKALLEQHRNPAILNSVINLLTLSSENLLPFFNELLENSDPDIRIYTLQIIGDRMDRETIPLLVKALVDLDANVKYHAIEAMGKMSAIEASDALVAIATGNDIFLASSALYALANTSAQVVYTSLHHLWENEALKEGMIELAAHDGSNEATKQLCHELNEDQLYRDEIVMALGLIHSSCESNPMRLPVFEELLQECLDDRGVDQIIAFSKKVEKKNLKTVIRLLSLLSNTNALEFLVSVMGNPDIHDDAIEGIKRHSYLLLGTLLSELQENEQRILAAIIALGRIGSTEAVPHLTKLLNHSPEIIIHATGALAKIGFRSCYPDLLPLLGHSDSLVRRAAVSALNSIAHPEMPDYIKKLLKNGQLYERESALRIAGYFGYEACLPDVLKALDDPEEFILMAAIDVLPFFDYPKSGKIFSDMYIASGNKLKCQILRSAAFMEPMAALPVIKMALDETDPWVRTYALRSAGSLNLYEVSFQIKKILKQDVAIFLQIAAIQALGEMRITGIENEIAEMASGTNNDLAQAAINVLGMLGTPVAFNVLAALFPKSDDNLKQYIIPALAGFNQADIVDQLVITATTSQSEQIRQQCIESLILSASPHAYQALLKLLKHKECNKMATEALLKTATALHNYEEIWQFAIQRKENKLLLADFLTRSEWPHSFRIIRNLAADGDPVVQAAFQQIMAFKEPNTGMER